MSAQSIKYKAHTHSIVEEGALVGAETRIWAFAHILAGAVIGENCNICDGVFIEGNVVVGGGTTIKCGVQLWDGLRVGENVFIGPNATFTNDPYPKSRKHLSSYPQTVLEDNCSIGANATILPGITIGKNAMVGAGSVVTKSVPANSIVAGNPAEIVGYQQTQDGSGLSGAKVSEERHADVQSRVRGVVFYNLPLVQDMRGDLTVGEFSRSVPFLPKRYFMVYNVKKREIRGEHAHHRCAQFLLCVSGSCRVAVDDGENREEFVLDAPTKGLYLPPLTWAAQYKYSEDAVLLVFASDYYDPSDYIRDYKEFIRVSVEARRG